MRFVLMLAILSVVGSQAYAQENAKPQPPPPRASGAEALSYESPEGNFRVQFPSKPTVHRAARDSSFGKSDITSVVLTTGFATYSVVFFDFPTVMDDRYDLNIRFDAMRDAQAKALGARLVSDIEFFFGAHYGRENVYETASLTSSTRAVVAGPRLFILSVETRGKISTQTGKALEGNKKLIETFFNSFQITKIPQPKQAIAQLPVDFGVSVAGRQFTSDFFEVSMTTPENWTSLDRDSIDMLMGIGKDEIKKTDEALATRLSDETFRPLAVFSKVDINKGPSDAMMFIIAEKAPYPNFLPLAVATTYTKIYLDPGEKVTRPPAEIKVNNLDLAWIETFESNIKLYKRMYFANRKGISLEILLTYSTTADLKTLLSSLQTLKVSVPESKP